MAASVTIEPLPDGRTMAVKRGDAVAIRREAEALRHVAHPGVVEFVGLRDGDNGPELVTVFAGHRTVATLRPADAAGAGVIVAALASTVADLHDLGWAHGRIEPSHVILTADDRPVLCGFVRATEVADLRGPDSPAADDVCSLGRLLTSLLDGLEPASSRRRRAHGAVERRLRGVASHATVDDPTRRPTARGLAASLHAALGPPDAPARQLRPSRRVVGAVAAAALIVAAGITGVALRPHADGLAPIEVMPPTTSATTTTRATRPARIWPAPAASGVVVHGRSVRVHGARYLVGRAGDQVVAGDWDCDGETTVAVVRPATGEVFLFDGWAGAGRDLVVHARARVAGAHDPRARRDDAGCAELTVVDAHGRRVQVPA